jgi:hypothetical protein
MEAEASFKLNLHPKTTFDKSKTTYGTDAEFLEVFLRLFRKSQKIQNLIFSSMRTDGSQIIQTDLAFMATSLHFRLTRKTLQKKKLAGQKRKAKKIPLEA